MVTELFGQRVKEIRLERVFSQEELSNLSRIDRIQISKIENGYVNVTLDTINRLATALKISIKDLFDFDANIKPKPFIKWAGGKTQLLEKLHEFIPKYYENYFEPFVGGGALLFSLKPKKAIINDFNTELCLAYKCFKNNNDYQSLISKLYKHEKNHCEEYYYQIRALDREDDFHLLTKADRAARLIYLNKACFNGLYRVNRNGFNNVPSGKKNKVITFSQDNFNAIRNFFSLSEIEVQNGDFANSVRNAKKNDFVYFDPPYDIFPDKNGFVDYSSEKFNKESQIRLRNTALSLSKKGVQVMLSNHNTKFINELYKDFNLHVVKAKRLINSNANGRGYVEEVIITNY